jgi:heat shock protein HtpX
MNLWKLRLSMVATLALIFGLSTGVLALILTLVGTFDIFTIVAIVVVFNIVQWLFAPHMVGAIYRVREMKANENPHLHEIVSDLSRKSNISTPKLMLAQIPLPNAFAYGSPLTGSRIAVTQGLLSNLNEGEVEAVIGHELGHLKHRDVQTMMVVSFLPALFYFLGYSLLLSGMFGGGRRSGGGGDNGSAALIGIAFMAFSQILTLFTLNMSRLREYYADRHSVSIVDNGAQKLSTGLAKIVHASGRMSKPRQQQQNNQQTFNAYKALFIADPDRAKEDSAAVHAFESAGSNQKLVDDILAKKLTFSDKLVEVFSTHPNIVKRLRALQDLSNNPRA